jgi:hypothetical protein
MRIDRALGLLAVTAAAFGRQSAPPTRVKDETGWYYTTERPVLPYSYADYFTEVAR